MKTRIIQKQFKRKESKYILNKVVWERFSQEMAAYMTQDEFATSTITNIYFDNQDFQMIQDSIAKKNGREKVRMRLYAVHPEASSQAFLEIKKKENKIGYKFRLTSNPISIGRYIENGIVDSTITDQTVTDELSQLRKRYGRIQPMMYIYYDRESFKGKTDSKIRITIDQQLLYRWTEVDALAGKFGQPLLDPNKVIMEVKVPGERPEWLEELLTKYKIEKQSFSKYGRAYQLAMAEKEGESHADAVI